MSVYKIYALICPFENRVVYVGQTMKTVKERVSGHWSNVKSANYPYREWILRMRRENKRPNFIILEYDPIDPDERERYWTWLFGVENLYNKIMGHIDFNAINQTIEYKRIEKQAISLKRN